jgi:predicted PurR-regulated permease PerM
MSKKRKTSKTRKANANSNAKTATEKTATATSPPNSDATQTKLSQAKLPTSKQVRKASSKKTTLPAAPKNPIGRYVSFGLLVLVIIIVGFVFYEVMASFLIPLFLAALLVVVFRPLHHWFLDKCGGREKTGASLTTAAILLVVLIPLSTLLLLAVAEGQQFITQFNSNRVVDGVAKIRSNLGLEFPGAALIRNIEKDLNELQQSASIRSFEKDQHQDILYDIEQTGKDLSKDINREWDTASLDDESEKPSDKWSLFAQSLNKTRQLNSRVVPSDEPISRTELETSSEDNREQENEGSESRREYLKQIGITSDRFYEFKNSLLGGKARAWLTDLANPSAEKLEEYTYKGVANLRDKLLKLGGGAASFVGKTTFSLLIMIIALYFFLLDGPKMIESFKGLSPLDDDHEQELVSEFGKVSRAVVVATLLSALVQGLLAGIGFYFAGLESIFLLTVLSALLAMVPFVGAASVWVPCCLYLYFIDNNISAAIGLGIYGALIISMADNVIKPFVLHGQSNLHPLLALLSVLGGVATLGPIGILIGPMVVAFLQTLLKILQREIAGFEIAEEHPVEDDAEPVSSA